MNQNKNTNLSTYLWIATGVLCLALLFARVLYPELGWLGIVLSVLLIAVIGALIQRNFAALKSRSVAFGVNSLVTVFLVLGILAVVNFIAYRYPQKLDVTKNKRHTLAEQTVKVLKGLQKPVRAVLFSKANDRETHRPLLDNLRSLSPKFEIEYVDPDKQPTRAKQAGIKKYGTLLLTNGTRESKVDDPTEEKITNALIKLLKEKPQTLCAITGHGEKSFASNEAEGYLAVKNGLVDQSYEIRDVNLPQEGKIPANCDALAIIGPTKAYFGPEVKTLSDYLDAGGRAILAMDINIKSGNIYTPELKPILESWHVKQENAIVLDMISQRLGDPALAVLPTFSKDNPITKDFKLACIFPFSMPLDIIPGAPPEMKVQWLAKTTPSAWGETDFKGLQKGEIRQDEKHGIKGPMIEAIAVDGKQKDSKATRNTRLVVLGSSFFGTNNFSRFSGNLDFFLNIASWVLEDEGLISIRPKDEAPSMIDMSLKQARFIMLMTVILIPLAIAALGITIWAIRRRL